MASGKHLMDIATSEAHKALGRGDYPGGCVIARNGEIISKASSKGVTANDATAHAELAAISDACRKLKTRFLKDCIVYASIEPCLMCAKAMVYARIRKVVYGTEHKEYGNEKTFDILKQHGIATEIEVVGGLDKAKASELLDRFLRTKARI